MLFIKLGMARLTQYWNTKTSWCVRLCVLCYWYLCLPVSLSLLSSSSPSGRKTVGLVALLDSGTTGSAGTGGWDVTSCRLTAEKYLSAPFLFAPFDFLLESSQVTSCLPGSKPSEELPFLLYLKHDIYKTFQISLPLFHTQQIALFFQSM